MYLTGYSLSLHALVGLGQLALVDLADSAMQPAGINCDDDHEKVKGEKKMDRL